MTIATHTIDEFIESILGDSPTPGGGSVAAVSGALAAALSEMVCTVTLDASPPADVETELREVQGSLADERRRLLELADEDTAAFEDLMAAYRDRSGDKRTPAIETASKRATTVPLEIATCSVAVLEGASVVADHGRQTAVTDAGASAYLAHACLRTALDTVAINLADIEDQDFTAETSDRAEHLRTIGERLLQETSSTVSARM